MIKYTADPDVKREYNRIVKRSPRPWDDHYHLAVRICGTPEAYFACGHFWRHYLNIEFFSSNVRREVPVNGVLIPAHFFIATIV